MPDSATVRYDFRRVPKDVTLVLEFHVTREWKVRYWIAVRLLRLAALVLGCGIEIENEDEERT